MDPAPGNPEDEFKFYLKFSKPLILNLTNPTERVRAASWVKKLMSVTDGESARLKNDYLKLLLFALQRDSLNGPFAVLPNNERLEPFPNNADLKEMVKQMFDAEAETAHSACGEPCNYMVSVSHDLKEYAAAQEIPNFGVHCYYAVSADPISLWTNAEKGRYRRPPSDMVNASVADVTAPSSVRSDAGFSVSFSEAGSESPMRGVGGVANRSARAVQSFNTSRSGADFFQLDERPEPKEGNEVDLAEFDPLAGETEIQQNLASMKQTLKALRNNTYLRRTTVNGSVIVQPDPVDPHTLSRTIDDLCRGTFQGSAASAKKYRSSDNDLNIVQGHTVTTSDPVDGSIIQLHKSMSIQHMQEPTDTEFTPRPPGMSSTPNDSPPRSSPPRSSPQGSSPQRSAPPSPQRSSPPYPQKSSPQKSSPPRSSPPRSSPHSPQKSSPPRYSPQGSSPRRSSPRRSSPTGSSPPTSSPQRSSPSSRRNTYPGNVEKVNRPHARASLPVEGQIRVDVVTATSSCFSMEYTENDLSRAGLEGSFSRPSPSAPPLDESDEMPYEEPDYSADWENETISDFEGSESSLNGQELLTKRLKERGPNLLPPVVPYYPPNNDGPSPVQLSPASKELQIRYQPQRYDNELDSEPEPYVQQNPYSGYNGPQYYNRNFGKRHLFGPDPGWQERWKQQTLPNDGSPIPIINDGDKGYEWMDTRQQRNEFPETSKTAEELDEYFQEQSLPTHLRRGIPTTAPDSNDYNETNYTGTYDGSHPDYSPIPKINEGEQGYDWLDTQQQRNEFPETSQTAEELDEYFQEQSGPTNLRRGIPTTAPDSDDYDEINYTGTYDGSHPNYKEHQTLLKQRAAQKQEAARRAEEERLAQRQTKKKPARKPYMKATGTAKKPPSAKRPAATSRFQEPTMDDIYGWAAIAESLSATSSTARLQMDGLVIEEDASEVSITETISESHFE